MNNELIDLGFTQFFTRQLTVEEFELCAIVRVTEVQRSYIVTSDGIDDQTITPGGNWYQLPAEERPTVGAWLLLDESEEKILRLLDRKSVFKRVAAGTGSQRESGGGNRQCTGCRDAVWGVSLGHQRCNGRTGGVRQA